MKYHLEWSIELQVLERKLLAEIEDLEKQFFHNHAPTFTRIIEKKIAFLKEVLSTIEANQNITTRELAQLIDQKLEKEQRALKRAKNVFETDKIFDSVRILGWVKYLILEKNGRVPREEDQDKDEVQQ
jgi:hypothetical protein